MVRAQKRKNQDLNHDLPASKFVPDHLGQGLRPDIPVDYTETESSPPPPPCTLESMGLRDQPMFDP